MASLTLPDFVHIGTSRSGTTWLFWNMICHPGIFIPRQKEVNFWVQPRLVSRGCYEYYEDWSRTLEHYSRHYRGAKPGQKLGDISVIYCGGMSVSRIQMLRFAMPGARLIFSMRNPVEQQWSNLLQYFFGYRIAGSYEELTREQIVWFFNTYYRQTEYLEILERWLSVFPSEQLLITFYEDVKERPKELLTDIFRHIGVSEDVDWSGFPLESKVYSSERNVKTGKIKSVKMPDDIREYLTNRYAEYIERLHAHFGERVAAWRCAGTAGAGGGEQ